MVHYREKHRALRDEPALEFEIHSGEREAAPDVNVGGDDGIAGPRIRRL
jgi:hypothetical protein